MRTVESLKEDFKNITLITVFEMPVIDSEGNKDWIVWNIKEHEQGLKAFASEDILTSVVNLNWDDAFSIDDHLQNLHEMCYDAVCEDDKYDHRIED
jgi:hypothetical protein